MPPLPEVPAPADASEPDRRWNRWHLVFIAATVVVGATLGWLARAEALGVDEATHLVLSKSLATGHYRDEFLVGQPRHAQYPPGMSLWLLILRTIFGASLDVARGANLILLACTALLLGDGVRRLRGPLLGAATVATIMLNPALLSIAGTLRSETLFVTLMTLATWLSLRVRDGERSRMLPSVLTAALAFFTRSAGVSMIAALAVKGMMRNRRFALASAAVLTVIAVAWFGYTTRNAARSIGRSYATDISLIATHPRAAVRHAVAVTQVHVTDTPFAQFRLPAIDGTKLDTIVFSLAIAFTALAGLAWTRRRWTILSVNFVFSGILLLVWPWADARFVTPMVPALIALMGLGTAAIATRARLARPEFAALGLFGALCVAQLAAQTTAVTARLECRRDPGSMIDPQCNHSETRTLGPATAFIQDSVPPTAIIAAPKSALVYQLAGRLTAPLGRAAPDGTPALLTHAWGVTHVLLTVSSARENRPLLAALLEHCDEIAEVRTFPFHTTLLTLRSAADTTSSCRALRQIALLAAQKE